VTSGDIAEFAVAEKEYAELEQRVVLLLAASRSRYAEAQAAAEHLREMQQRVDRAADLEALAEATGFRDSADLLVGITTRTAFLASGQHAAAENDAQAARERVRALKAALPASRRAGDVLGGHDAPSPADPLLASDEEI
jgi:hypothetical protein